jgi:hypothetical protein
MPDHKEEDHPFISSISLEYLLKLVKCVYLVAIGFNDHITRPNVCPGSLGGFVNVNDQEPLGFR